MIRGTNSFHEPLHAPDPTAGDGPDDDHRHPETAGQRTASRRRQAMGRNYSRLGRPLIWSGTPCVLFGAPVSADAVVGCCACRDCEREPRGRTARWLPAGRRRVLRRLPRSGTKRSPWVRLTRWTCLGCWPWLPDCGARRRYPDSGPPSERRSAPQRRATWASSASPPARLTPWRTARNVGRPAPPRPRSGACSHAPRRAAPTSRVSAPVSSQPASDRVGTAAPRGRTRARRSRQVAARPDPVGARGTTSPQARSAPPAGRTPPPSDATVRPLRRDRLGGLVHEYLQVA
jgi:hypothetical protein